MTGMDYPVHETIDVIDGTTIYKNDEWWKAVLLYERYGRKIGVYLWKWRDDNRQWTRKQKYVVRRASDWEVEQEVIDAYVELLDGDADRIADSEDDTAIGPDIEELLEELDE